MKISDDILNIAFKQFDLDVNISGSEEINENVYIAPTRIIDGMRIHEHADMFFRIISFLGKVYIMADPDTIPGWTEVFKDNKADWFFSFGNLRKIDHILKEYDREIYDTHIYYLPDADAARIDKPEDIKILNEDDIKILKGKNPFHNALCYSATQPDVIAVSKLKENETIAMAGASRDGKYLYQIGIDVLKGYRGKGLATELVTFLKQEMLDRGMTPFYGTSEGHSLSRSVGVRSGFLPAFSELLVCRRGEE